MKVLYISAALIVGCLTQITFGQVPPKLSPKFVLPKATCNQFLTNVRLEAWVPVPYDVQSFSIAYPSQTIEGNPAPASGHVALPLTDTPKDTGVVYFHGTVAHRDNAPSRQGSLLTSCLFAAWGFPTASPDYTGLGDSPGRHPYLHAESVGQTTFDLLQGLQQLAIGQQEIPFPSQLYLTGYSQGGHGTLAAHRFLQNALPNLHIIGSTPMAGPYQLSEISLTESFANPKEFYTNAYMAYIVSSYRFVYGDIADGTSSILRSEYKPVLEMYNGNHTMDAILDKVPAMPDQFIAEEFKNALLTNPLHPLRIALKKNNVHDWRPFAPIHFVYAGADRSVSPRNALTAFDTMRALDADVQVTNVGDQLDHLSGLIPSFHVSRVTLQHLTGELSDHIR